jgi:predicted ATPase
MSDGAVRMLCWAVILNSLRLPPLLVIDEPELGLHVAWMNEW